jgi:hypothetical protein
MIRTAWGLLVAVGLATIGSADALADNLVQNSSFEDDGMFSSNLICPISGWTGCSGINAGETSTYDSTLGVPGAMHAEYLAIGTVGGLGHVSQNIATIVGQTYRFTFQFSSDGDPTNRFRAMWGSNVLTDVTGAAFNPDWFNFNAGSTAYHSFDITATSATTTISFAAQGNARGTSFIGVDDVTVASEPEVLSPVVTHVGGQTNYGFDFPVAVGITYFLDPQVATGYIYRTGLGDPNFSNVELPDIGNSGPYELYLWDGSEFAFDTDLAPNTVFNFAPGGVSEFEVLGIDPSLGTNPDDPNAFVAGLTFEGAGSFTGSVTPMTTTISTVSEPASFALFGIAVAGLRSLRRRQLRKPYCGLLSGNQYA